MKTVVLVIAEKIFRDEEYQVPKDILSKAGIKVVTASTTTGEATGKLGLKVRPDILIGSIDTDELDALTLSSISMILWHKGLPKRRHKRERYTAPYVSLL
ncbi:MAG: hypothetical protein HW382_1269 [Deltaproteobacteria bacterium]|nr:hypothetical protein [Deltaproteobacteria bacterium]